MIVTKKEDRIVVSRGAGLVPIIEKFTKPGQTTITIDEIPYQEALSDT